MSSTNCFHWYIYASYPGYNVHVNTSYTLNQRESIKLWQPTIKVFQDALKVDCPSVKVELFVIKLLDYRHIVHRGTLHFKSETLSPTAIQTCVLSSSNFRAKLFNTAHYPKILGFPPSHIINGTHEIHDCGKSI